ncbi:unnamed protein product [Adineta ricciae]|uniref:Uncharacterized protein n=1 Tax=Adineta ricciae TaxID=249248 RepID=A0A815CCE9_ADIRI|nr:unnamed protein product [Adineta ricciae]
MKTIDNELHLLVACKSIHMILKSLLTSTECITACVVIERAVNILDEPDSNKMESKKVAKRIMPIIIGLVLLSHVNDPYYRKSIEDFNGDDRRIWCLIRYPSLVDTYDYFINLMHLVGPLIITIMFTLMIVILLSRIRSRV